MPVIEEAKNIHELSVKGVNDAVIVASGPSLNKNVDQLCKIQDKVFIVTALRSLPVLHEAGIEPDLVIQLDAEDDDVAKQLSLDNQYQINNFLFELVVNPGFLLIPAKQKVWSHSSVRHCPVVCKYSRTDAICFDRKLRSEATSQLDFSYGA